MSRNACVQSRRVFGASYEQRCLCHREMRCVLLEQPKGLEKTGRSQACVPESLLVFFSSHLGWSKMNPGQLSPFSEPCGCSGTLGWPAADPAARPPSWGGCVGSSLGCWLGETSTVPPPRFGDLSDPPGGRARDVPCPPARTRSTSPCHRGVPFLAANLGRGGGLPWNRMNLAWRLLAQAPEPFTAIWVSRGLCSQGWSEFMGCPAGAGSWGDAGEVGMAPSPSLPQAL